MTWKSTKSCVPRRRGRPLRRWPSHFPGPHFQGGEVPGMQMIGSAQSGATYTQLGHMTQYDIPSISIFGREMKYMSGNGQI